MESLMHQLTRGREDSTLERNVSDVSDDENLSAKANSAREIRQKVGGLKLF